MKDNVVLVNTFPPIINLQVAFLRLHHMPIPWFVCYSCKKLMNVHEAIEYFENLDVSSVNDLSEDEDFISRGRLIILPPNNKGDRDIDVDSGDGNELLPKKN